MNNLTHRLPRYHVYVIELHANVLDLGRFAEANPGYSYDPEHPPLYVGMTARSSETRFEQHCTNYKASRYTRSNAKRLRMDLAGDLVFATRQAAEQMEVAHAAMLRARGFAVWQN